MKPADWYVIQVQTGRELAACKDIVRACRDVEEAGLRAGCRDEESVCTTADGGSPRDTSASRARRAAKYPLIEECFAPRYATRHKVHGEWVDDELLLLPGYVVAVSRRPADLAYALRRVSGFTHLLRMGETFAPLSDEDRTWLDRWTKEGDRTIPMSVAYKEGDTVVVTEGPLKGKEATITRLNRRKCLAHIELRVGRMTVHTTVGLSVLPPATAA